MHVHMHRTLQPWARTTRACGQARHVHARLCMYMCITCAHVLTPVTKLPRTPALHFQFGDISKRLGQVFFGNKQPKKKPEKTDQ